MNFSEKPVIKRGNIKRGKTFPLGSKTRVSRPIKFITQEMFKTLTKDCAGLFDFRGGNSFNLSGIERWRNTSTLSNLAFFL